MSALRKPKAIGVAGAVLAVLILAGGYLALVGPKRSKAAELDRSITDTQSRLTVALAQSHSSIGRSERAEVAELYRLSRAMPDSLDTAGVLLDLSRVARADKVQLNSIAAVSSTSTTPTAGSFQSVPLSVELQGRYGAVTQFLADLRHLVVVRDGGLRASGRLLGVDSVQLGAADGGFPQVKATLTLEAYVFTPAAAASPTTTTTPAPTSDTSVSAAGSGGNG